MEDLNLKFAKFRMDLQKKQIEKNASIDSYLELTRELKEVKEMIKESSMSSTKKILTKLEGLETQIKQKS